MGILLDVYEGMAKEAAEVEVKEILTQQVEILDKYASLASELMQEVYPNDHTKDDVIELADRMIQHDMAVEVETQKTAEAKEIVEEYVKVAEALLQEEYKTDYTSTDVEKLAEQLMDMEQESAFEKEAEVIVGAAFIDEFVKEGIDKEAAGKMWEGVKGGTSKLLNFLKQQGLNAVGKGEVGAMRGKAKDFAANAAKGAEGFMDLGANKKNALIKQLLGAGTMAGTAALAGGAAYGVKKATD